MLLAITRPDESTRLEAVNRLGLLDNSKSDKRLDDLTKEATVKLSVPISTLTVLDANKEHYRSCQGLDAVEGERSISFCGHALFLSELMIIPDCKRDERFSDNPMVTGKPFIRFYAGMGLLDYMTKQPVAVFCVKDTKPRKFSLKELEIFLSLASRAEQIINGVSDQGLTE